MEIETDCGTCSGSGEVYDGKKWKTCGTCGGSGVVTKTV